MASCAVGKNLSPVCCQISAVNTLNQPKFFFEYFQGVDARQTVFIEAKLMTIAWTDDLNDDETSAYEELSELVRTKVGIAPIIE